MSARRENVGGADNASVRMTRAIFEVLEPRWLMSGNPAPFDSHGLADGPSVVYIESNNPSPGQNAVLAFRRNPATGALKELAGGPFLTGGTGFLNDHVLLGPDDSDREVIASPDGRFLFAVNQGSNSIAVFRIHSDGSLDLVDGHAFSSGGVQPVSLALSGNRLYVTNRGDEIQGSPGSVAPNYTGFDINSDGSLTSIPNSTVTLPVGLSPSQVLVSNDNRFLFGDNFTPPPLLNVPQANTIAPFDIGASGSLTPAAGGPVGAPVSPPLILGLDQSPTKRIVYAGLTGIASLGVFTYDNSGALTFVKSAPTQGGATCWVLVNADGTRLYVGDSATDSVGVFSLDDPLNPVEIQEFALAGPKSSTPGGPNQTVDFQLALDPTGRNLYVLNHQTALDGSFTDGNQIHVLSVAKDGTLTEPGNSPVLLPASQVPPGAHPQGIVVVTPGSDRGHGHERFDVSRFFSSQPVHQNRGWQTDPGADDPRDALDRLH